MVKTVKIKKTKTSKTAPPSGKIRDGFPPVPISHPPLIGQFGKSKRAQDKEIALTGNRLYKLPAGWKPPRG